ncbi:MAG: hypothetical protein IIW20_02940 [Clostridia bacterium]|nr:hypothetical protein [Clostridia bacterium]
MSSLFCLSRHFGINVSGSDRERGELLSLLLRLGADVYVGERDSLPEKTDLLVYSHAIGEDSAERRLAREIGIPEVSRAEYMGALMTCYEKRIGISGSHGKSTVTAMTEKIFRDAKRNPTALSGAALFSSELPFRIGALDYLIYEGCEYKDSFLSFSPTVGVFLNMELDHTDYFKDISALSDSFVKAINRSHRAIINIDDRGLSSLLPSVQAHTVTYGSGEGADYRYSIISERPWELEFSLLCRGEEMGGVRLPMLGAFNISNAAAAIAAAMESGIDFETAARSLAEFSGIGRRLERIGEWRGRAVFYDYAHHPTEIKASIEAVKGATGGRVAVIFRPHTYSRTRDLYADFKSALSLADELIILDVAAIREKFDGKTSASSLAAECGGKYCSSPREITENLPSGDGAIILMGAADLSEIKKLLTNQG